MDQELDDLLRASSPTLAERTDDVQRDLDRLVSETETAVSLRKRRATRRVGLIGLAVSSVLGLGVTASAAGLVDTPWTTNPEKPFPFPGPFLHADVLQHVGTDCKYVYAASDVKDPKHPVGKNDRYRALEHARQFVLDFDISTISVPDAERRYLIEYSRWAASAGTPPDVQVPSSQLTPDGSPDDIRTAAVQMEMDRRLQADLKARGLSTHAVTVMGRPECENFYDPQDLHPDEILP